MNLKIFGAYLALTLLLFCLGGFLALNIIEINQISWEDRNLPDLKKEEMYNQCLTFCTTKKDSSDCKWHYYGTHK